MTGHLLGIPPGVELEDLHCFSILLLSDELTAGLVKLKDGSCGVIERSIHRFRRLGSHSVGLLKLGQGRERLEVFLTGEGIGYSSLGPGQRFFEVGLVLQSVLGSTEPSLPVEAR